MYYVPKGATVTVTCSGGCFDVAVAGNCRFFPDVSASYPHLKNVMGVVNLSKNVDWTSNKVHCAADIVQRGDLCASCRGIMAGLKCSECGAEATISNWQNGLAYSALIQVNCKSSTAGSSTPWVKLSGYNHVTYTTDSGSGDGT